MDSLQTFLDKPRTGKPRICLVTSIFHGIPKGYEMPDKMHRRPAIEDITGLSRSTIYAKMDQRSSQYDPDFPKPVRLGKRAVAWRETDIVKWLSSRTSTTA